MATTGECDVTATLTTTTCTVAETMTGELATR